MPGHAPAMSVQEACVFPQHVSCNIDDRSMLAAHGHVGCTWAFTVQHTCSAINLVACVFPHLCH